MRIFLFLLTLLFTALPAQAAKTLLVFGDSLSAGYGISSDAAWPALLQTRLAEKRLDYSVANLSVSGETTAGGRSRLPAALDRLHPSVVVIALGANDGLRGLPLAQMRDNLTAMIEASRQAGAKVLLVGVRLPPNYGPYANQFEAVYGEISHDIRTPLVAFLLAGVADHPELFQADMLHPTAQAQPRILDNVWVGLKPLIK